MLLKAQRNELLGYLQMHHIPISQLVETRERTLYKIGFAEEEFYFEVKPTKSILNGEFAVETNPFTPTNPLGMGYSWAGLRDLFAAWAYKVRVELDTPDLWAEAAKAAQLFAPTATPSDDKFTRAELAEVQGQLRALAQSFATAALPEAARQQLMELTQTAAVKAEGLTKKDWQNWIIGGFISAITALLLNPTQAAEVLKLVKAAFGGLFLH